MLPLFSLPVEVTLHSAHLCMLQVWSPFPLPRSVGDLDEDNNYIQRLNYTHEEYINLVLHSGHLMTHDYSEQSTEEDPRMLAFFDSLVQRELEGWSTDDGTDSDQNVLSRFVVSSASSSEPNERDDEEVSSPFSIAFASVLAQRLEGNGDAVGDNREGGGHMNRGQLAPQVMSPGEQGPHQSSSYSATSADNLADSAARLPGQRRTANRKSISSLIAQKRTEYLSTIKNIEKRAKRKNSTKPRRDRAAAMRAMMNFVTQDDSSNSSASDSNSDENRTGKRGNTASMLSILSTSSSSSTSLSSSESDEDQGNTNDGKKGAANNRWRPKHKTSKFKDTDVKGMKKLDTKTLDKKRCVSVLEMVEADCSNQGDKISCDIEGQTPATSDTVSESNTGQMGSTGLPLVDKNCNGEEPQPCSSGVGRAMLTNGLSRHSNHTDTSGMLPVMQRHASNNDDSNCDTGEVIINVSNNGLIDSSNEQGVGSSAPNNGDLTNNNSENGDNSAMDRVSWEQFRRFKHRVERNVRHYRRHHQPSDDSDGD